MSPSVSGSRIDAYRDLVTVSRFWKYDMVAVVVVLVVEVGMRRWHRLLSAKDITH